MTAKPVSHGLRNLRNFAGRERRGAFWKYIAAVIGFYGLSFALSMTATMAAVSGDLDAGVEIDQFADKVTALFFTNSILAVLAVGLLAAAVSRRLHDSGRRAFWGLIPLPFLLIGLILMPAVVGQFLTSEQPDFGLFGLIFLNNIVYLLTLGGLVTMLMAPGDPGANRFGEAPE